jgi:hypothetical protein
VANTIAPTVVDAKGDLIAGTAADTVGRLAVGSNGQMLVADSTASTGLAWVAPGMLLQVVNATTSTDTSESAGNYADVTGLTANITPLYSNSKIIVMVSVNGVHKTATGNFGVSLRLMRGATQLKEFSDAFGYGMTTSADAYLGSSSYTHYDSPATTSSTTYKVQLKTYGTPNTASVNKANSESSITLMEIRQ